MNQKPYTFAELKKLIPKLDKKLEEDQLEFNAKGLPPMNVEDCKELFYGLMDIAHHRPLKKNECFLHGQLLAAFEQAVMAQMLKKNNERYYVVSETQIQKMFNDLK